MMDIEKAWKESGSEISISRSEIRKSLKQRPESVLRKLRNQLLFKLLFTVLFTLAYTAIAIYFEDLFVRILFSVLIILHIVGVIYFTRQWQRLRQEVSMDRPILEVLKEYRRVITISLRYEHLTGLLLYPVAASAGFFLALTEELSWQEIMESRMIWIIWFITIVLLTPLSHVLAKWMNKVSFGKYVKKLEGHIKEMEDQNGDESLAE